MNIRSIIESEPFLPALECHCLAMGYMREVPETLSRGRNKNVTDQLIEKGYLSNLRKMADEFLRIFEGESTLSELEQKTISNICLQSIIRMLWN